MNILKYNPAYSQFQIVIHSGNHIDLTFYTGNKKSVNKKIWSITKYNLNQTRGNAVIYESIKPIISELIKDKNTNFNDQPVRRCDLYYGGFYVGTSLRNKKSIEDSLWIWDSINYKFHIILFGQAYELSTTQNGKRIETPYEYLIAPSIIQLSDYQEKKNEELKERLKNWRTK